MSVFNALILADRVPEWVSTSFPIIRTIMICIMTVCAVFLIITVLMQSNTSGGGTNVISGTQESYYSQNKGSNREGRLKKITIITTSIIAVSTIIFALMQLVYSGY
ncbi:MAG: preprotein translocase subunit SecG [Clostridia bacterium]